MKKTVSKRGRPAHVPTKKTRNKVRGLSGVGTRYEDIALRLAISSDTLVKYYKEELDYGRIDANASIAKSLYDAAKKGNTQASIFWLKTRAGWKETDRHEHVGNNGTPIEMVVQWKDE